MLIGERTAEEIKINMGSAFPRKEEAYMEVTGRNLISGLPKTITISSNETIEAMQEPLNRIMETMHSVRSVRRRSSQRTSRRTGFA